MIALATRWKALIAGVALALPFVIANALVANGFEPARWFFRDVISDDVLRTNPVGLVAFLLAIALLLAGGIVALRPAIRLAAPGLGVRPINLAAGALILALGLLVVFGLGAEIVHCQALGVPNCD